MPRLDCYYKPGQHIDSPDFDIISGRKLYSNGYLSDCVPADFDKDAVDGVIIGLANILEDCDHIYSSCENIENDIVACFSMDDKPLDVFDLQLCSDIMFRLKEISRYGILHLQEKTSEVSIERRNIEVWLTNLSNARFSNSDFDPNTYTEVTSYNVFDYGSWVPRG